MLMRFFCFFVALCISVLVYGQTVELIPETLDFGSVEYGEVDSLEITITNNSGEAVIIEEPLFFEVYETSPFYVNEFPSSVSASSSESFFIVFKPEHNISHNSEMVLKFSESGAVSVNLLGDCAYPMGYYDGTEDLLDTDLKDVLSNIISSGYISHSYNDARDEMYLEIDNQRVNGQGSSQNRLTRAYVGTDAVGYTSRQDLFSNYDVNCEHTFPQGFFDSDLPMKSDVHHLVPTDVMANSIRGNLPFGETVSGIDWSEGGSSRGFDAFGNQVFEPRDAQKGHSARAILYFVLRYQNFGGFLSGSLEETLRSWNQSFPPDEVEEQRNDDIEDYQNNRNPFIDYPQFAHRIFSFHSNENRPNVGNLELSHSEVDFGVVQNAPQEFNLILVNDGERFYNVSGLEVTGEGFSLAAGQEDSFSVSKGDAAAIAIRFDPSGSQGASSGSLTFNTNLADQQLITIPLQADGVLSTEEVSAVPGIYPNPASDYVRFFGKEEIDRVEILDMSGRLLEVIGAPVNRYNVSELPEGVYLIRITTEAGSTGVRKLVKSPN